MPEHEQHLEEFTKAYDAFAKALFRHCYFRVLDRELAMDLVQETFVRVWEYMADGKSIENMRGFLYRTAHNVIIDHVRQTKRRPTVSLDALEEQGEQHGYDPSEEDDMRRERAVLLKTLDALPHPYRDLLIMRYIDGFKPAEIAAITGRSTAVISVQLHRGVAKLRSQLKHE